MSGLAPETNLKFRKAWLFIGFGWIALLIYLSLMPHPPQIADFHMLDKLEHFAGYSLLMLWFSQLYWGLRQRASIAAGLAAMGVLIEILQGMQGFRVFEYADMLANTLGVLIGWGLGQTPLKKSLLRLEQLI